MKTFKIEVSDTKGIYPAKVYEVQAESELMAYQPATDQFIRDNNHPERKPNQRISAYLGRFWNRVV